MALRPEQIRALDYVRRRGTEAPLAEIRRRVAETFETLHRTLDSVSEEQARRKPAPDRWCVQEIADHLLVTNRPAVAQLLSLQSGESPEAAIPASLQSEAPMERRWTKVLEELRTVNARFQALLEGLSDEVSQEARAPVVMVVRCATEDGRTEPVEWVERFDWKAFALVARVHVLEHIDQIRRTLGSGERGPESSDGK